MTDRPRPELQTPVDTLTGVPLPLMPVADLPPVPRLGERNIDRIADWHHPFHPRADLIHAGLGLVALRNSRKQWALYGHHHDESPKGYHSIYTGPPLPETEDEQFRTVVFSAAGYVPRRALVFTASKGERIVDLSEEQRNHLWASGQLQVDKHIPVRDFLIDYTVRRDFVDATGATVDEFLHTDNEVRRLHLGNALLRAAAYEAASPLMPLYRKAKRSELVPPGVARNAGRFVVKAMVTQKSRRYAHRALQDRFKSAA